MKAPPTAQFTYGFMKGQLADVRMREILGKGIASLGVVIMLSALVVNPWLGVYYQDYIENYADVMLGYVWWSVGLGLLLTVLGLISARRASERWTGAAMVAATLSLVVLADRGLLVVFGLPNWIPDPVVGYRHRPDVVRVLGSRLLPTHNERLKGMRYVINQHGHHDDDFPEVKPQGEFRGLMLGDSVTMGDGVEKVDTIANQLEAILGASGRGHAGYQIINAGVGGYSTYQEYVVFRESLVFSPNFATVGFCFNNVTDSMDSAGGADGAVHHSNVLHLPDNLAGYLANETGFSRLISWVSAPAPSLEQRSLSQAVRLREMASASPNDERFQAGWKVVLDNLEAIYRLSREHDVEMVLLVYPFVSQLFVEELQRHKITLLEHARANGVDAIDLAQIYEKATRADVEQILAGLDPGLVMAPEDVDLLLSFQASRYFMDEVHPTPIGNRLAAGHLAEHLHDKGLVDLNLPTFHREQWRILRRNSGEFTINMPHTPKDVARTAYVLFLLQHDIEEIRHVVDIGIRSTDRPETLAKLYRLLGEIERSMGNEKEAMAALRKATE